MMTNDQKNADSLAQFNRYIAAQKPVLKIQYEQLLVVPTNQCSLIFINGLPE